MLEFLDLPWDPKCLDFHDREGGDPASKWQVRQKIMPHRRAMEKLRKSWAPFAGCRATLARACAGKKSADSRQRHAENAVAVRARREHLLQSSREPKLRRIRARSCRYSRRRRRHRSKIRPVSDPPLSRDHRSNSLG